MNMLTKDFTDACEKQFSALSADVKDALEKAGVAKAIVQDLEQKLVTRGGGFGGGLFGGGGSTLGEQVAKHTRFQAFKDAGMQGTVRLELKAITSAQAGTAWAERDMEAENLSRRAYQVRDLLTVVPTTAGSVDYARQTTRTNNAAVVAEGALKPTSAYVWGQVNLPMRTIAHITKITRQALDDAAQLAAEVETEMRYGLQLAEDVELLSGDGTGAHLTGMIPLATDFAPPFTVPAPTMIDAIGLALLQQSLTEYPTDGVVINPTDWMRMRLIKDADGKYILGDPATAAPPVLFGKPVATTQAMGVGSFLIGGFKRQKLYDRMTPEVLIASENEDDFVKNLYTMRCEERLGLAVRAPTSLIYGTFAAAIAAATVA